MGSYPPEKIAKIGEAFKAVEDQQAQIREHKEDHEDVDLAAKVADLPEPADLPMPMKVIKPGRMPDVGLKKRMRKIQAAAAEMREQEAKLQEMVEGQEIHGDNLEAKLRGIEEVEKIPHDPRWKELDPEYAVPEPLSDDQPGPNADLRERDFTGEDWSGLDLSGANLERAEARPRQSSRREPVRRQPAARGAVPS